MIYQLGEIARKLKLQADSLEAYAKLLKSGHIRPEDVVEGLEKIASEIRSEVE